MKKSRSNSTSSDAIRKQVRLFESNTCLKKTPEYAIAKISFRDLQKVTREPMGKGSFSLVHQVEYEGETRVLKRVNTGTLPSGNETSATNTGAMDLALEGKMLERLRHPNIVQVHAEKRGNAWQRGYFIVLDYLHETLDQRLERAKNAKNRKATFTALRNCVKTSLSSWKGGNNNNNNNNNNQITDNDNNENNSNKMDKKLLERLRTIALGIAQALEYLHEQNIVYRDLKPTNIGFDAATDQVKLFDFGVARDVQMCNKLGKRLGVAGTPRYMANEVLSQQIRKQKQQRDDDDDDAQPYGFEADVYSFGVLLWEICTLQQPFSHVRTMSQFQREVVEQNARPALSKISSQSLQRLISSCWDPIPSNRPTFQQVVQQLKQIIDEQDQIINNNDNLTQQQQQQQGLKSFRYRWASHRHDEDCDCFRDATDKTCSSEHVRDVVVDGVELPI